MRNAEFGMRNIRESGLNRQTLSMFQYRLMIEKPINEKRKTCFPEFKNNYPKDEFLGSKFFQDTDTNIN